MSGQSGRDRGSLDLVAIGVSLVAVVLAAYGTKVSHDDRGRDTRYSVRGQVRNLTGGEALFGLSTDAKPRQTLVFRGRVHNWGNVDAKDVTINTSVNYLGGDYLIGSCRVRYPGDDSPRTCGDRMGERELHLQTLPADDAIEVTFRYRTRQPPCDGYVAKTTFTVRSADRAAIADTANANVSRSSETVECDSPDGDLLALIPGDYRDTCKLAHYAPEVGNASSHIACYKVTAGVPELDYWTFKNEARAERVYERRRREIGSRRFRQCAGDPDGEGYQSYSGRSQHQIRYFCWERYGHAWIELVNRRYKMFVSASRTDGGFKQLFSWVDKHTP